MTSKTLYDQVFENNRAWVAERNDADPSFFEKLAREQRPEFLYIGCADSRVPANEIMGLDPGQVFVHRNIANVVGHADLNVQSVIEYAVTHLGVQHIVVCGHYGCGGVQAAMQSKDFGLLNPWLRQIRDVYRGNFDELEALPEGERFRRLVEANVRVQCENVIKTACVQQSWLQHKTPTVHGWVYDLHDGLLHDLQLDFDDVLERIRRVYRLG